MFFEVKSGLNQVHSEWKINELELENYLIGKVDDSDQVLSESVFGEPLLLINNQIRTQAGKRADILALDRQGNGVIIELKKDDAWLGVDTQALQYLADFSFYKGSAFLSKFAISEDKINAVKGFLGSEVDIEDVNTNSRIILVARGFDETLFSMGEWLSSKGVSFRCIAYTPVQIEQRKFLSFEVAFERNTTSIFGLSFTRKLRKPGIYWHNISTPDQEWWNQLKEWSEIPTCFEDKLRDAGYQILNSYVVGDKIIAYAKGYGAIGWAEVTSSSKYELIAEGSKKDKNPNGGCRHRLSVTWHECSKALSDGLSAAEIREQFGIYHPLRTSVAIEDAKGLRLIQALKERFI